MSGQASVGLVTAVTIMGVDGVTGGSAERGAGKKLVTP